MRSVMCAIFGDSRRTIVFSSARMLWIVLLVLRAADFADIRERRPGLSGHSRHFVFEQGHHVVGAVGQRRQPGRNLIGADRFLRSHRLARAEATGVVAAAGQKEGRAAHEGHAADSCDGLLVHRSPGLHRERDLDTGRVGG